MCVDRRDVNEWGKIRNWRKYLNLLCMDVVVAVVSV